MSWYWHTAQRGTPAILARNGEAGQPTLSAELAILNDAIAGNTVILDEEILVEWYRLHRPEFDDHVEIVRQLRVQTKPEGYTPMMTTQLHHLALYVIHAVPMAFLGSLSCLLVALVIRSRN